MFINNWHDTDQKDGTAFSLRGHYARKIIDSIPELIGKVRDEDLARRARDLVLRASTFYGGYS